MDAALTQILETAISKQASDIHLSADEQGFVRIEGELQPFTPVIPSEETARMATTLLSASQAEQLKSMGSVDGAVSLNDRSRFRYNIYQRNSSINLAFRLLPESIASLSELGLSEDLYRAAGFRDGLVLVAGPTGSGKSTTIAALLDRINESRRCHMVTIEDPIEFIHPCKQALVNQREVGRDVPTFQQALVDAVRQDPDVILVGELRNEETVRTAISAAETGHLVFASTHAGDCKSAIERLISSYPAEEQNLAQRLVATVLRVVLVQHLLPGYENPNRPAPAGPRQRVLASEMLNVNSAASNLIANGTLSQLAVVMESGGDEGMWTLDTSLARLLRQRQISEQTARSLARNPELLGQLSKRVSRV